MLEQDSVREQVAQHSSVEQHTEKHTYSISQMMFSTFTNMYAQVNVDRNQIFHGLGASFWVQIERTFVLTPSFSYFGLCSSNSRSEHRSPLAAA